MIILSHFHFHLTPLVAKLVVYISEQNSVHLFSVSVGRDVNNGLKPGPRTFLMSINLPVKFG